MKFTSSVIALVAASGANAFVPTAQTNSNTALSASYLDQLGSVKASPSSGVKSYLDSIPAPITRVAGAGFTSYRDAVAKGCSAVQPIEECAEAITDYMSAVSNGAADPVAESPSAGAQVIGNYLDRLASQATVISGAGIASYLDSVPSAPSRVGGPGFASYLDSVGGPSSKAAPSAPAVKSFLDSLASGETSAPTAPAVTNYLESMSNGNASAPTSGAGIANYLSALPATNARVGGAGIGSYLDSINCNCDAVQPTEECAQAIGNYLDALSSGAAPAASTKAGASAIGNYLDALASNSALSGGAGFASYLDSVGGGSSSAIGSAPAVKSYLDNLTTGAAAAPSTPAVQSYLEDVSSGAAAAPTSGAGIASYLDAIGTNTALSGGAGITSHANRLAATTSLSGRGMPSYLDTVGGAISPAVSEVIAAIAPTAGEPTTTIDTKVFHDGTKTTITITSVTTVVIDDAE